MKAKKIVVAVLFLGGGYYFIKKILPMLNKNRNGFDAEIVNFEPTESIISRSNSIGLPKYVAPKNKEIPK